MRFETSFTGRPQQSHELSLTGCLGTLVLLDALRVSCQRRNLFVSSTSAKSPRHSSKNLDRTLKADIGPPNPNASRVDLAQLRNRWNRPIVNPRLLNYLGYISRYSCGKSAISFVLLRYGSLEGSATFEHCRLM
jgi:hypothetical protein